MYHQTYFKDTQEELESDRHSLASSQTDNYSTLTESNALILENMDGTFCQGTWQRWYFVLIVIATNPKGLKEREITPAEER